MFTPCNTMHLHIGMDETPEVLDRILKDFKRQFHSKPTTLYTPGIFFDADKWSSGALFRVFERNGVGSFCWVLVDDGNDFRLTDEAR